MAQRPTLEAGIIATKGKATPSPKLKTEPKEAQVSDERVAITLRLDKDTYRKLKIRAPWMA